LIAAIALAGFDNSFRVLLPVLCERSSNVGFLIEATLIIAPHEAFVFAGVYQFAFACLAFCHVILLNMEMMRVTLTNTTVFANDAETRRIPRRMANRATTMPGFAFRLKSVVISPLRSFASWRLGVNLCLLNIEVSRGGAKTQSPAKFNFGHCRLNTHVQ
jgi:hypothetical protein